MRGRGVRARMPVGGVEVTAPEFKAWMTARGLKHADIVTQLQVARATVDLWRQSGTRYITDVALFATWPAE